MEKEPRISSRAIWRTLSILLLSISLAEGAETGRQAQAVLKMRDLNDRTIQLTASLDDLDVAGHEFDSLALAQVRTYREYLKEQATGTDGEFRDAVIPLFSFLDSNLGNSSEAEIFSNLHLDPGESFARHASNAIKTYAQGITELAVTETRRLAEDVFFFVSLILLSLYARKRSVNSSADNSDGDEKPKNEKRKNKLEGDSSVVSLDSEDDTARELALRLETQANESRARQ